MRPDLIAEANTPTGGDMGAHVFLPAFVRDNLVSNGRIMGWSNDWYAGFPVLYFYFPLPILSVVALDVFLPYGVAFKAVTAAGVVALPAAAYYFTRSMGFSRPIATLGGVAGGTYVFMESHAIFGGNIKATMAGEFAFGWGLALGLVYLGVVIKGVREGKGFSVAAGVLLALTALSHLVVTVVVIVASLPLLLRRGSAATVVGSWGLGLAVAGFWAVPLLTRVNNLTTDMGWSPVEGFENIVPREFIPIAVLGIIGLAWSLARGHDVVVGIWLAVIPVMGFLLFPIIGWTKLYNARLLPFWYLSIYIFAGIAVGMAIVEMAKRMPRPEPVVIRRVVIASVFFLLLAMVSMAQIPGWIRWNYTGYEEKDSFAEYEGLMQTVDALPAGRVQWEANSEMNRYGTPMALMLIPYWTESSHPSMEGLYFESSITTPFHFLNTAEVSKSPSNPVRGLDYHTFDFERATQHLPVYGIRYYVSFSEEATEEARSMEEFTEVAQADPWTVFELADTDLVEVATSTPTVFEGGSFLDASLEWYERVEGLDYWLTADGPDEWPRTSQTDAELAGLATPIATTGTVSDIVLEQDQISFHTEAVGVPHLVKVSYFPNWKAQGADGPYRAAPSLMVVIPTEEDVVISFDRTWDETLGMVMTAAGIGVAIGYPIYRRRRRRGTHFAEDTASLS